MPLTPLSDTSGFAPLSNSGLVPLSDPNTSLLENKMRGVAAISDAKRQALTPSVVPSAAVRVKDGDTIVNNLIDDPELKNLRLDQIPVDGEKTSIDTFETPHPNMVQDARYKERMFRQKLAISKDSHIPVDQIPDTAVYGRGEAAKANLYQTLKDMQNIGINPTGKIENNGRPVADIVDPITGQSIMGTQNTPQFNANYNAPFNETQRKEDALRELVRRNKATEFSVSDANRETLLGGIANAVAGGAVAASDQIYNMTKAPFELGQQLRERGITNKQRELSSALTIKQEAAGKAGTTYTPTAEEQAILETPTQAFMRETVRPVLNGERDITARDLLVGLTNVGPFQQNTHEKLQQSAFIKENITDRLTAYQEGARKIYNSGGSDELFKDSKALYTDSVEPTFVEGVQKFKKGHVADGSLQMVDAIANAGAGAIRVAANNKQAVAEEGVKQIVNSFAASRALLQTFLGMYTNTNSEITDNFVKEHGRYPEGREVDNIHANSALSAIADSYSDKWLASKPGIARAMPREFITEGGQNFLEQDAAKQGASKIDRGEVFAGGVVGALGAGGHSVITSPEAAIIEAAQGVGTIAKGAISGAKKAGPTIQWAAQAVGDAGREYGNVLPDGLTEGMSDATKAGLAKLTGAVTGMPTDSLGSGLKAVGSLAAHATKEGAKAVGGAVGDYLDSAFPITSQAVKDFKVSNLVPDKISNAVDAAKQAVTDAAGEVGSSTTTDTPEGRKAFVVEASLRNDELFKELTAIGTKANPTNAEGARFTELLTTIRKNKETIDGIKAKDAQDDTTDADIVTATTKPTDPATDPAIALQAVDRVIRSMRQSNEVSPEQLIAFEAFKTKATLTPEQTSVTSAFIATQQAMADLKKMSKVSDEVIYGQKAEKGKKGFLGMVEHQAILSDALDQENIPAAQSALDSFKAFAASQVKKAASLTAMSVAAQAKKYSEVKALEIQFKKDFPTAQPLKNQASTAFENLANTVGKEANMLTTAVAEAELHFKLGTTTEAKAVPVAQESGLLTPVGSEFPNAPSEYKIDNIDEMIATNGGVPAVSQFTDKGYQSVNFKDFHLSIDNENKSAEVAKVELGTEERGKGHGINAYKALGDALAERGITLTSSEAQYADGKNMWHKLVKQGHAVKKGSYFEYVPTKPAIESKPAPVVDPIVNEVTVDPVTNNTAVDQVTTDTSGNAEEESVTDPVTIVADATPRPEPISKEAFNKLSEEEQNKHLGNRYNEGYGGQFTIGDKVISEEHGPGVIKTGGGRSKWVVTFDSGIEANVPDNTLDVKEVPSPVVEVVTDTVTTIGSEFRSVNSLQAKSDKRIDRIYKIFEAEVKKDNDPYMTEPNRMKNLGQLLNKELSSRIAGLQISAEAKQDLQSRYAEAIKVEGSNPLDESRPIIEEVRAIEKEIAKQQADMFESSNTVEATADTTEVVYDLAMIKDLALKKNYSGRTNLITAVNVIFRDNSLDAYTAAEIAMLGKALEDKENKSLGDYLLDSTRKFITDKTLRDYYSAKMLDKVSKYSALLTTPNFFSTLKDAGVKDALGLTPEQLNGLDALTGFVNKFAETFKKDTFTDARLAFDITTLLKNPALYFMKEEGRDPFDENFVSTLATVGYSWVANNANSLIDHSNEAINALLGRDSKHKVTYQESNLLSDKQIVKTALIHSLGSEIVSSLGMTFNTKEDGSIESKMVEALGAYAVMTLEHMGVLAKSEVIHKKVFEAMKRGEVVSDTDLKLKAEGNNIIYFTGVATVVTPVKGKSYSNTELSTETKLLEVDDEGKVVTPQTYNVQGIVDDNRMSKGLLSELFDYKQQLALPLLVAPTLKDVSKFVKRGIKRIPERVRKALHKYNSNAFTVNMGNHTVLDFLEREQQLRIFKYNENLEGVHDVDIKSVQGTNRTTKNELEAYYHLVDHLKLQPKGMFSAMYFMSTVVSNGRANMEGLINPQASKFFRHMIGMASWESTIDSPAKLKLFKIAVAEALGSKVDRQGDETSLEAFDRLIKKPEIADGIATIKYLKSGIEMSAEEKLDAQEAILAAIEKGGSEIYTLEALTALSTYSETEPFTTRMTKEVDGITNGVIIGLIQLMGQRPKEMLKFLEAGGVSQDSNFVYGDFISKVGSFDNYQRVASTLVEYMDAFRNELVTLTEGARLTKKFTTKGGNTSTLDGIDFFIGNLGDADNLTSEARDLAKNPVLITNYGAAFKKIIQSLGEGTIENFYKKLTEARHDQEALNEIAKQLNKILKRKPEDAHKFLEDSTLPYFDKLLNEALKFTLSNEEIEDIQKHVANSIGAAMQHALETHFGTFITKRKELNNAMTLVHAAFIIKYDAAYKAARDLKGSNLSREERDALVKTLEPSMASFDHAMSDGEMDTELFVAPNESKTATDASGKLDEDYRVQVTSNTVLPHGTKSTTVRGQVSYYGFPGVRSVILAIHSSDGAVQYKLMETSAVLNVHDADVSGIDGTMAMTQRQNLAFKEVMEDYSMRASIQKTLLRAMKALTEDEWYVLNEQLQITDDKAEGFLGHDFVFSKGFGENKIVYPKYESVHAFVDVFTDTTKRDLAAKKALLASLKSWGQYNLNHGAYVTEEESEALFAAIDELRDSLERDDAESNTAIQAELAHMENAERNRINNQIKSSATEDIANFVADFKPITVSASTVNSIFDELGKIDKVTDFPSHTEHLRTVLNESIRQVLNPMELLVRKLGKANSGVLAKGKIYLSMGSTGRLHTTDQSAQEVYAHELVHAVTEAALSSNYWLRKQARSLYEKVQDQITPESFLDYDAQGNVIVPAGSTLDQTIAKAKAVHDHIFDNNDITKTSYKNPITNEIENRQYSNGLLEFVAMGTTNAKFIKILAGINTNKSKRDVLTYADRVYNLFVGAINSVTSLINKTKDPAANVALMILMHKLANANQVKSNIIMRKFEENGHLEDIVNSKLYKVLAYSALKSGEILKARKNKTLSAVGEMIGLSQDTSFEAYKKVAGKLARKHGITHENILSKLVTEAEGITTISAKYMHKLAKSNMLIDQLRRLEAQSLTNQILGSFIAGTPSKSEGIAITKVMLKTDMSSLIDSGYTWDKMFGLLKSRSKRLAEIAAVEKLLQAAAPTNFDYYKTQAVTLGYMMVNGQPLKWGTKINAVNIAHLGGTGKKVEGDLKVIEGYLDILASLHAIKYSDAGHVTDFVTVAEREFAKDKDNNGVMLSYLVYKDLKARALEQSFEGQKEQMFKGYIKEIYNPRVSIEVAPDNAYLDLRLDELGYTISTETKMKAKGYIKVRGAMSKDPTDLNKEPMSLYVNKDGDTATFNKMGVSLTSDRRKGHDLGAGYSSMGVINPALIGSWDTTLATKEGQKILARADYADLSKIDSNNLLVPVENAQHEIVGYRYLMNEATKDDLLEKENDFAKVLGAMEGSIVDKQNSKQINNEYVNLMHDDFVAEYAKDPNLFIKFSPHSQNAKHRELYAMLPNDMRREIKRVWKSDVMYVRANMFDAIFGYRKFTVTEGSKEEDEINAMHEGVLTKFRIALRDKLRTPIAKKGEIALQEIAKEVKDAIVIKLGGTLYNNVISNNLLLWVKGVGRFDIVKHQAMFLDAARQYHKDVAKLMELERSVRINPKLQNSANVKAKINSLKDHMANNPIAFLMDSGVSQTIIEDVDTDESKYTYKGMIEEKLSPLVSRVPKPLKTLASIAYMTHDTKLYKFMREATQLSDLVARATLHKHNTEKKGMSFVDSINDIKDTFIDYDAPTSKQIQYLNDTNFLMFTKFFIRSQKIIYQTYANAPARALSLLGFEEAFGEMSTINDSNIINTSILGKINFPLGLAGELAVPHGLLLLDPTGAGGGSYTPE